MATSLPLPTTQTGSIIQIGTTISPFAGQTYDYWGSITINGIKYQSPTDGYFVVKGAKRSYRWDVQNGLLLQGAIEILRGVTPSPFTLDYYFWADEQYQTFLEIAQNFQYDLKNLLKTGQGSPFGNIIVRAVTIYHPALDVIGISKVICEDVGAPEQQGDDHMWKATFALREYFPPLQLPPQDKDSAPQEPKDPLAPELQNKATQVQQLLNTAKTQNWVNPLQ